MKCLGFNGSDLVLNTKNGTWHALNVCYSKQSITVFIFTAAGIDDIVFLKMPSFLLIFAIYSS